MAGAGLPPLLFTLILYGTTAPADGAALSSVKFTSQSISLVTNWASADNAIEVIETSVKASATTERLADFRQAAIRNRTKFCYFAMGVFRVLYVSDASL